MTLCECNAIDVMNKTLADSSEILLAPLCKRVCVLLERERKKTMQTVTDNTFKHKPIATHIFQKMWARKPIWGVYTGYTHD